MVRDFRVQRLLVGEQSLSLVDELLEGRKNVLLTPTWIAQALKTRSQWLLMSVERHVLWPMVRQLMTDLQANLTDEGARTWAGAVLALLDERPGEGAVAQRVDGVLRDPASTPRGHYEEGMHGYFRGLQFLLKSIFDARLDPTWGEPISHFVFPWPALDAILTTLRARSDLRQRWEDLHHFYTVATGEPDCVSICHLLDIPEARPESALALSKDLGLPRINRELGIGVQGLAERFTRHGEVYERLKETFLPRVTAAPIPRESVYAVVNMRSLLYGFEHHGGRIPSLLEGQVAGLLEALATVRQQPAASFFDQYLMAQYELVTDLQVPLVPSATPAVRQLPSSLRRRLNAFAANLASLLELSILAAKQPMTPVAAAAGLRLRRPSRARIYVEALPRPFFERLSQAGQTVVELCDEMADKYRLPTEYPALLPHIPHDPAVYDALADLSEQGRYARKDSPEWRKIAPSFEKLVRNPNVAADAYRHVRLGSDHQYFLQWCTAMASFRARLAGGVRVQGGELLFVEGWNDKIVPGRREPLTNSVWRAALGEMRLGDLRKWALAPGL